MIDNFKEGELVTLDAGFNNSSEVTIVRLGKLFATVTDDGKDKWDVMRYRLTPTQNSKLKTQN